MADFTRQTAHKIIIKDILENKFVQQPGWDPNYILIGDLKVSRVNVLGSIVGKLREPPELIIDDGTGKIPLKTFESTINLDNFDIGNLIITIGKVREYGTQRYIAAEIIKKINDPKWVMVRKKELNRNQDTTENDTQESPKATPTPFEHIISIIKKLDTGSGAPMEEVIATTKDADALIRTLLKNGEIFEVEPGKIKVL